MKSLDSKHTENLGESIGKSLRGGEVIELSGDVGAGKTTFVRGLARGMVSLDRVSSPTFTIYRLYKSKKINLYHYDFYRLNDPDILKSELADLMQDSKNAIVLEWADTVEDVLPLERIRINISVISENEREIQVVMPESINYVKDAL